MIAILVGMKFSFEFPFQLVVLSIFLMYLLVICLSSSEQGLFESFIHFKICVFFFLPCESSLYVLDFNFSPDVWFANIFPISVACCFTRWLFPILGRGSFFKQFYSSVSTVCPLFLMSHPRKHHQGPCYSFLLYILRYTAWALCQLGTNLDIFEKRRSQLRNCLHQIVLWICLWRCVLDE